MQNFEWLQLIGYFVDLGWLMFAFSALKVAYHLGNRYTARKHHD